MNTKFYVKIDFKIITQAHILAILLVIQRLQLQYNQIRKQMIHFGCSLFQLLITSYSHISQMNTMINCTMNSKSMLSA